MDKNARRVRKGQLRKIAKSKIRQDSLICDYVRFKYPDIYSEAGELYNQLNIIHPSKHDLRKTYEYKKWRASITGETVKKPKKAGPPRPKQLFPNIQNLNTNEVNPRAQIIAACAEGPPNSTTSEQASDTMDSQPPMPIERQSRKIVYKDTLQLRIPLISHKSITHPVTVEEDTPMHEEHPPTVTTETLEIITEEILDEAIIQPSLCEELPQDLIEKVIEELRAEPELEGIFANIEEQVEFEQLGMDIDINEDYALEDELYLW